MPDTVDLTHILGGEFDAVRVVLGELHVGQSRQRLRQSPTVTDTTTYTRPGDWI